MSTSATVTVRITNGWFRGKEFVFDGRTLCKVGRAEDCFIRFPEGLAFLDISRRHCQLDIDPPTIRARDLGSRNGTFINGTQIGQREVAEPGGETPTADVAVHDVAVHNGDEIKVGHVIMQVKIRGENEHSESDERARDLQDAVVCAAG